MIRSDAFRGKRYAVLGLARSGLATVRSLVASGADVTAWDARDEARAQVTRLREVAADVVAKAGGPPTGFEKVDQRRAKARAMAEARVKSLDLLLGLIDGTADPAACTAARAAADHLWDEYARP